MKTAFLSIFIFFASILLYLFLKRVVLLLLRALLNGPLNAIYLDYLKLSTKLNVEEAFASLNSDRAWSELVFSKVYEIGSNRVPYAKREQNLKYIKEAAIPSRKLVDELIKILPKQYRNLEFQAKLACYICDLANKVKSGNGNTKPAATVNKIIIDTLSESFTVWIVGFGYFIVSLIYVFEQYPPLLLLIISILFLAIMNIPTIRLMRHGLAKVSSVAAIVTITLVLLGSFASAKVNKIYKSSVINLDLYQNPNVGMLVEHAEWITMNNRECDGVKFSVYHYGQLSTPIEFRVSDNRFSFTDKDCTGIIPKMETNYSENQAYEFYVSVRDNSVFFSNMDKVFVAPEYFDGTTKVDFAEKDYAYLKLENWFWNATRNLSLQIISFTSTIALLIMNYAINKRA